MNILFLLSCLEASGSETYCLSLARAWGDEHRIFWISDKLHYGQKYWSLPISKKAIPGGLVNTLRIARFIKRHHIDVVHSHSRRAHWIGAEVASLTGRPHVVTIHQPPPVHLFSKLFPCLGDRTIAIDEAVVEHLERYFQPKRSSVTLIRNGIELDRFIAPAPSTAQPNALKKILVLGRLTGGRWEAFRFLVQILKKISSTLPPAVYRIAGRIPDSQRKAFDDLIRDSSEAMAPSRIEAIGWNAHIPELIAESDGVIAGGRSALESLACGKPVLLMGEGGVVGVASEKTWPEALRTNLGDHLKPKRFSQDILEAGLRDLLNADPSTQAAWGRAAVQKYYDIGTVAREVSDIYHALSPHPYIPPYTKRIDG